MIIEAKFGEMNNVLECNMCITAHGDTSHITNRSNPHKVTAEQTGAVRKEYVDARTLLATDSNNDGNIVLSYGAVGGGFTTEIWTFTLEDGSTVTKAVYVG